MKPRRKSKRRDAIWHNAVFDAFENGTRLRATALSARTSIKGAAYGFGLDTTLIPDPDAPGQMLAEFTERTPRTGGGQ
jgi:DNA-binding transcriptional ArsR family regulator